jgi:hypothetical protein
MNARLIFKSGFFATACFFAVSMFGCKEHVQPRQPQELSSLFARWFVNPADDLFDSLMSAEIPCSQWEAMTAMVRAESEPTGACTTAMVDSSGTTYALGFKTPKIIDAAGKYPLVVYLHGGIGTSVNNKGERAWDMLEPLADSMDIFLASPSASRSAPWW